MVIVIPYKFGGESNNHGPVRMVTCGKCGETGFFELISEKVAFSLVFIPIAKGGETWALQCPHCEMQLLLPEGQAANAIALNRALSELPREGVTDEELQALVARYPLPCVDQWVLSNTDWICPKCKSEVPRTFGECWNCGYEGP